LQSVDEPFAVAKLTAFIKVLFMRLHRNRWPAFGDFSKNVLRSQR